jgi:nucleotide-binding universal stress UspA family protein
MIKQHAAPEERGPDARPGPIMIELDSSYESAEALRWAADLSKRIGTELLATCTWHPGIGEFRPDAHDAVVQRLTTELKAWSVLAADVGINPALHVVEGDWPAGLLREARTTGASLLTVPIAVSPSPSSSSSEVAARQLLQHSTVPVALVPPAGANRSIRRVLVGTPDGVSPINLIDWATRVAIAGNAELHIVAVLPLAPEWVASSDPNSMWQVERRIRMSRWTPRLESLGLTSEVHIVEGSDPVDAWARMARHLHADVIVACAEWRGSVGSSRRATSLIHLCRDSGLVVMSIPSGPESNHG